MVDSRPAWGWLQIIVNSSETEQVWITLEGKKRGVHVRKRGSNRGQNHLLKSLDVDSRLKPLGPEMVNSVVCGVGRISKTAELFNARTQNQQRTVNVSFSHTPAYSPKHTLVGFHSAGIYLFSRAENRTWLSTSVPQAHHGWCTHTHTHAD